MKFVHLHRQFRELTDHELADPSVLAIVRDHFGGIGWNELLRSRRVVILAEAGSGKTREMQAAVAQLCADGKAAFFLPIEALHQEDVRDVLAMEPGEAERFDAWLSSEEPGWFFLDAVDELRLIHGKLDTALGKVSRALGAARARAQLVVSCRPTDWRPVSDLETINIRFPPPQPQQPLTPLSSDAAFLDAFEERKAKNEKEDGDKSSAPDLRVVVLFPLSREQMKQFATACGVADAEAFLNEISRHDAWSFARRPLDLSELAVIWKDRKRLGTRLEQHEFDVENNLKERPDRADDTVLTREKAHEGAERLALALALTGMRTIRAPEQAIEQDRESGSLDAADILMDWTDAEIRTLLRRSIFDPATYGRVRFHHRSVQEFLAARRLAALREHGMSARQLERLLFAERYGERVVIPSMNPIAAWLAHTDANVCRELLAREPEILIVQGDPESLPLDVRTKLVESFVEFYGGGDWRGLHVPMSEARRLANPDLAPVIRRCWDAPNTNEEVPEFLLQLIWLGEIGDCMDIARAVAFDPTRGRQLRALAILALEAGKQTADLRALVDDMLAHPERWPPKLVYGRIDALFPGTITVDELETLIRRTPEPRDVTSGFSWSLREIAQSIDPASSEAIALRDKLAAMIWDTRDSASKWHNVQSQFGYLGRALVPLCDRQLQAGIAPTPDLVRACVIANRFHSRHDLGDDEVDALRKRLGEGDAQLRAALFRQDVATAGEIEPEDGADHRFFVAVHKGALPQLISADWDWVLPMLGEPDLKDVALSAALHLWMRRGEQPDDLEQIRSAVSSSKELITRIERAITPRDPDPVWVEHEQRMAENEVKRDRERAANRSEWQEWRATILADPEAAFSEEKRRDTFLSLAKWLRMKAGSRGAIGVASWSNVRAAFGDVVADRFEAAMKAYWRENEPPVRSRRPPEEQNTITHGMMVGLTGLSIEAAGSAGWAHALNASEAHRAAEWATVEMTLPEWFLSLMAAHPVPVAGTLEAEAKYEITNTTHGHAAILSSIEHGDDELWRLMAPRLKPCLLSWTRTTEKEPFRNSTLDHLVTILTRTHRADRDIADRCEAAFLNDPTGLDAITWLRGLAICDLRRAHAAMVAARERMSNEDRDHHGILWLGVMFGRGGRSHHVPLDWPADVLIDLTRFAYECVRRDEDVVHDGIFSPDARDDAEGARNQILTALLDRPGAEAHAALIQLAEEPLFAHLRDRLRLKARDRAAFDSEPAAITAKAFTAFESRYERPPQNSAELAQVMADRLSDLDYDLHHHDFNDRHVLRGITTEPEMQPVLARKLDDAARNAYRVSREEEVADKKETDVRLAATAFNGRAVIEIKIGDKWSVRQLEDALETQLLGQYLRHQNCSVGCLLVTYAGRKGFEDPNSGASLSFEQVIERLSQRAAELEQREQGCVALSVVALDLR